MADSKAGYLDSVLTTNRESLKWLWLLVMAFAMESAAGEVYADVMALIANAYAGIAAAAPAVDRSGSPVTVALFFLVFLPVFIRFVYGGNRYIDLKFIEIRHFLDWGAETLRQPDRSGEARDVMTQELREFSSWKSLVDILLLVFHGLIFIFLARSLGSPAQFIGLVAFLLCSNVVWLCIAIGRESIWDIVRFRQPREPASHEVIGPMRRAVGLPNRKHAPKVWIVNNTIFAVVVLILIAGDFSMGAAERAWWCVAALAANSVVDFWLTWPFYFPALHRSVLAEAQPAPGVA